ncbi:protein trapped in endoderm-1-like isoform X1 [Homarus americanus]|uniref:protein trapped in endoderm-1-like isoform X1 n=1 Tax=Homarus americanus TaxID=6706 RepID=UPI001C44EC86|nr:protein trapped in endoderm-1-like isoform X1 [Homarus americanus]XP_042218861.1 protein trapped in endoderm-1-like isoform X1 [Homarus americanus]
MNTSTVSPGDAPLPEGWIIAAQAWALTVACVGGVGNLVTLSTIAHQLYLDRMWRRGRYQHGKRPVVSLEGDTLLLLHLSFCDFLYCTINLPLTIVTYGYAIDPKKGDPSKVFCTGAALFRYVNALAEWTTLGLLTVQRCVDLGRFRGARFFRPRPTIFFIVAIWVGSVLLQMGALTEGHFAYDRSSFKCDLSNTSARVYFYCLQSLLPCILMLTGCCSIICQVRRNTTKLLAAGMHKDLVTRRCRAMMRSTALLLALLLLFLFCVIPICVHNVETLLTGQINIPLNIAIYMLYWVQYGVNFFVYAAVNPRFRKACKQFFSIMSTKISMLWCKRRKRKEVYKPEISQLMLKVIPFHTMTVLALPILSSGHGTKASHSPMMMLVVMLVTGGGTGDGPPTNTVTTTTTTTTTCTVPHQERYNSSFLSSSSSFRSSMGSLSSWGSRTADHRLDTLPVS